MVGVSFRSRDGVTLLELLIVVVILGLLAAFAFPQLVRNKEKAIVASMQSDLRNLATAEEALYNASSTYSLDPVVLNITLSPGNSLTIGEATVSGWSATMANPGTPRQCYLFHGNATPIGSATTEGDISCS
jgi:prepilin-type N-terminal cleavage/methylation domain-containing protein